MAELDWGRQVPVSADPWSGTTDRPPQEFRVWLDLDADPPCVGVAGEIDLGTVAPFRQALDQAREANNRRIVVDCQHVTFMGSTGVREVVRIVKQLDRLELRSAPSAVRRVIEMSGLDDRVVMT